MDPFSRSFDLIPEEASGEAIFLLVIPCYTESKRLPDFLKDLCQVLAEAPYRTRILVVDDGSSKMEQQFLRNLIQPYTRRSVTLLPPLLLPRNLGKGGAILRGWRQKDESPWLAFVDADGAISAQEVRRIFDSIGSYGEKETAYFCSRIRMLGRTIKRETVRHLAGRIFATLVGTLLETSIYDSQCGFKVVPREAFSLIDDQLEGRSLCFDLELLIALRFVGTSIIEVPIDWRNKLGGHVSLLQHGLKMIWTLLLLSRHFHQQKESELSSFARPRNWLKTMKLGG